ncbi:MAG: hypothetical protein LW724_13025 [Planctomycetaceae bacterium]|jgi:hypothetical protein|nr:hypothetical protein [Planctomycetaceae bacterium]
MRDTRKTERIELETLRLVGKIEFIGPNKTGTYQFEWSQCLSRLESRVAYFSQDIRREGAVGGFSWPAPNVGMAQVDKFLAESSNWPASIPAVFPRFHDIYKDAGIGDLCHFWLISSAKWIGKVGLKYDHRGAVKPKVLQAVRHASNHFV